jgi:hypothetical protein
MDLNAFLAIRLSWTNAAVLEPSLQIPTGVYRTVWLLACLRRMSVSKTNFRSVARLTGNLPDDSSFAMRDRRCVTAWRRRHRLRRVGASRGVPRVVVPANSLPRQASMLASHSSATPCKEDGGCTLVPSSDFDTFAAQMRTTFMTRVAIKVDLGCGDRFAEVPRGHSRVPHTKERGPNPTSALLCSILQWLDLHRHEKKGVAVSGRTGSSCNVPAPVLWYCRKGLIQSMATMCPSIVRPHRWISFIYTAAFYPTPTPSGLVPEYSPGPRRSPGTWLKAHLPNSTTKDAGAMII